MTSTESLISIEAVRTIPVRGSYGTLNALKKSISDEGMRRPVCLWKDGTLISGGRRHRAFMLLGRSQIPAVFVDTIEDAAKRLLGDNEDDHHALAMKGSEMCRLWELLRRLDEPAAVRRADAARRQGAELRRQTAAGQRRAGRTTARTEDYVLKVLASPFGMSETTAKRLWTVYGAAHGLIENVPDEKREIARESLADIDAGVSSIWANYRRLLDGRTAPVPRHRRVPEPPEPVSARTQRTAWDKSLPQMEGLVAGLVELGPPNAELTWEQVGPVHTRLMAVRRELEKIIKKMRESSQS